MKQTRPKKKKNPLFSNYNLERGFVLIAGFDQSGEWGQMKGKRFFSLGLADLEGEVSENPLELLREHLMC